MMPTRSADAGQATTDAFIDKIAAVQPAADTRAAGATFPAGQD